MREAAALKGKGAKNENSDIETAIWAVLEELKIRDNELKAHNDKLVTGWG